MSGSILIVDDEPGTRRMLRLMLELKGFQVSEAEDGLDALAKIALQLPDLVLLDVMMPNLDGIATCRKLRSQPETAALPIIMLSGKAHASAIKEGLAAGANEYFTKPMSNAELVAAIRNRVEPARRPA